MDLMLDIVLAKSGMHLQPVSYRDNVIDSKPNANAAYVEGVKLAHRYNNNEDTLDAIVINFALNPSSADVMKGVKDYFQIR